MNWSVNAFSIACWNLCASLNHGQFEGGRPKSSNMRSQAVARSAQEKCGCVCVFLRAPSAQQPASTASAPHGGQSQSDAADEVVCEEVGAQAPALGIFQIGSVGRKGEFILNKERRARKTQFKTEQPLNG